MVEKYYLILNPILTLLVYKDARKKQVGGRIAGYTPLTWAILVLTFGVFGFAAYLLVRMRPRRYLNSRVLGTKSKRAVPAS